MIAQPVISTPTPPPQASQTQPPANANGFLALLAPDNSSLLTAPSPAIAPSAAPAVNGNKSGNSSGNSNDSNNSTPYLTAPAQQTILPTAVANQGSSAPVNAVASAALPTAASQLTGNAIPSNALMPASASPSGDASPNAGGTQSANGATNASGNSTDFGANVNARVAVGAPIYASQPSATMTTVPPHLLNAAAPDAAPGTSAKSGDDAPQKPGADAGNEPVLPASNASTAGAVLPLHPSHVASDPSQTDAATSPDAGTTTQAATANGANAAGNGGDASAASSALAGQPNAPITTPAQIDAAVHTAAPYVPVGEQVALNLKQALAADNNQIRIQLKPASLGTIDVKLNLTQDGRVSAVISADRSDTLNMLKQDSATLQQSLRDAGLNADSGSLSFNLRGDAQSFAQNSPQSGFGRGGSGGGSYSAAGNEALSGSNASISSQSYHNGSLDIEV